MEPNFEQEINGKQFHSHKKKKRKKVKAEEEEVSQINKSFSSIGRDTPKIFLANSRNLEEKIEGINNLFPHANNI